MISIPHLYELFSRYGKLTTDSRKVEKSGIYLALKGERFDGNAFAADALAKGAAFVIIDNRNYAVSERCLVVNDGLKTLQELARFHRRQFEIPVLAITGSNGKTTTKELISAVLNTRYNTHSTKGNFNNHIGLPLTLLAMKKDTEVCVLEMGANHPGEIAGLCNIAEPTHGLITNIGKAHIEGFGSLEGVKKAKGELFDYLGLNHKMAFVNKDEKFLEELAAHVSQKLIYGQSNDPESSNVPYETKFVKAAPFVELAFLDENHNLLSLQSNLIGTYNFNNLMTAVAIGRYFKVPSAQIKAALEAYVPANNRSQIISRGEQQIIMDAYNANPSSMRQALQTFAKISGNKKIAILGDMFELGPDGHTEHQELIAFAETLQLDGLLLIGSKFGACEAGNAVFFPDADAFKAENYMEKLSSASHLLIKGSRSMKLETLLNP